MNKNSVETRERQKKILKFLLFYLANEEIQQKMEQENSKYICYFEFCCSGFPHSQDKRAGISKNFLSFFTLFLYTQLGRYCLFFFFADSRIVES